MKGSVCTARSHILYSQPAVPGSIVQPTGTHWIRCTCTWESLHFMVQFLRYKVNSISKAEQNSNLHCRGIRFLMKLNLPLFSVEMMSLATFPRSREVTHPSTSSSLFRWPTFSTKTIGLSQTTELKYVNEKRNEWFCLSVLLLLLPLYLCLFSYGDQYTDGDIGVRVGLLQFGDQGVQYGLHVWAHQAGSISHQVAQHLSGLLLVSSDPTVLQLCSDLCIR